ncbi:MAG: hypothetical protein EXS59_01770 [Candidatus Taylorbacteria bacterium]|nr:hypothetical protein [Candidatus Taylorbacteria bacterium]
MGDYFGVPLIELSNRNLFVRTQPKREKSTPEKIQKAVEELRTFDKIPEQQREELAVLLTDPKHDYRTDEIMEVLRRANENPTKHNFEWISSLCFYLTTGRIEGLLTWHFIGTHYLGIRKKMD